MSYIRDLLWFINELGSLLPETKGHYRSFAQRNRPTFDRSLYRLKEKGYIKKIKSKNKTNYILTQAGKDYLNKNLVKQPRGDGFATLITYDIPEAQKRERTRFRRYLLRNGFTLIQRSLLVSPNKLDPHLVNVAKELKILSNIKIVSGKFEYIKFD